MNSNQNFSGLKILIIGDVMIDHYIHGYINRISSEAPVPILDVVHTEYRLGGASNVANNIKSLGATPILVSVIGHDTYGEILKSLLVNKKISSDYIIPDRGRCTTVKTRVQATDEQLLRYDNETCDDLSLASANKLISTALHLINSEKIDGIIFEDYNKGILTSYVIESVLEKCKSKGIPVFVDPKRKNFFQYKGVTLFKPNLKEFSDALNLDINDDMDASQLAYHASALKNILNFETMLLTLGSKGIFYYDRYQSFISPIPSEENIIDVSGAGDTVISIACLTMLKNFSQSDVAKLCNAGANVVCQKKGVSTITPTDIFKTVKDNRPINIIEII